jgi:hypothetical protein
MPQSYHHEFIFKCFSISSLLQVWPDLPNVTIDETITEDEAVNVSFSLINYITKRSSEL